MQTQTEIIRISNRCTAEFDHTYPHRFSIAGASDVGAGFMIKNGITYVDDNSGYCLESGFNPMKVIPTNTTLPTLFQINGKSYFNSKFAMYEGFLKRSKSEPTPTVSGGVQLMELVEEE